MNSNDGWGADWDARRSGADCGMCQTVGGHERPGGLRILEGQWSDAFLGRWPVRVGYSYVVWKGRHVAEPTELSAQELAGFWSEVTRVAAAIEDRYRPVKMNWLSLGNGVPHLHVHLVPRHADDPRAGAPIEADAFELARGHPIADVALAREAEALRAILGPARSQDTPVSRRAGAMGEEFSYEWRCPLTDTEMVELVESHGGRPAVGWWNHIRGHSLGWVTARTDDGVLVGFVNVAWDGGDHAFLLDTKTRGGRQHRGIGTAVVRRAAEEAKAAGCEWLHVDFEPDLAAFYMDACGFGPTDAGLIHLPSIR